MQIRHSTQEGGLPLLLVVQTEKPAFALQADGTWKESPGGRLEVPVLTISGGPRYALATYVQDLRDEFGRRDEFNVIVLTAGWRGETLMVALAAQKDAYKPGRGELRDLLLSAPDADVSLDV